MLTVDVVASKLLNIGAKRVAFILLVNRFLCLYVMITMIRNQRNAYPDNWVPDNWVLG